MFISVSSSRVKMDKPIEVEIRVFISREQHQALLQFFRQQGQFLYEDEQMTYYFDCGEDLRIQKSNFYSKIWLKKGKIHAPQREEIEVKLPREDFENLEKLFLSLGYKVGIKWFRRRHAFYWRGVDVAVDYTRGYGHILELEKKADEQSKNAVLTELRSLLAELGIFETPQEEFQQKYLYYKEHWRELV